MAGPVFKQASSRVAGTFQSQSAGLVSADAQALGIITQVNIQYQQSINRIFDLNRSNKNADKAPMYYIGGRAQGTLTIGRLLGPKSDCDFYEKFGDVCKIQPQINMEFAGGNPGAAGQDPNAVLQGCGDKNTKTYSIKQPVLTGIGISQNAQDFMINENVTMMFADMECE
jgi:hypothetical protein